MAEEFAQSVGQNEPIVDEVVARERRFKLVEHFHLLNPPTFAGVEGSEAAEYFLNRAEKIFDLLGCTGQEKVVLATYSLQREADTWWNVSRENVEEEYEGDVWEQFRQAFLDRYFPFTIREDKAREFDLLVQTEEISVDQYEAKFSKLSRYAPETVNTPAKRARKFERGLLPRIRNHVAAMMLTNYEDLYRRAQMIEKTLRECDERESAKEKMPIYEGASREFSRKFAKGVKRGRFIQRGGSSSVPQYSGYTQRTKRMSAQPRPPMCPRCGRWHSGWQCTMRSSGPVICYQCGQPGHVRWSCPQNQRSVTTGVSNASRGRGRIGPRLSRGSVAHTRVLGRMNAVTEEEASHSKII